MARSAETMTAMVAESAALPPPASGPSLATALRVLRRHAAAGLAAAATVAIAAVLVALLLPPVYRSSAIILIEQQEIPRELVRSTITSYADQRIQETQQRVMTSANLRGIVERYQLYRDELEELPFEVVLERMRGDIGLEMIGAEVVDPVSGRPTEATIAFTLSYRNRSAQMAQRVANELTTLYLNENLRRRTELAGQTSSFLAGEADKFGEQVTELERRLAGFKEANAGRLPEQSDLNAGFLNKADTDIETRRREIRLLEERLVYLEAQLALLPPQDAGIRAADGTPVLAPRARLKLLESEYARLAARYAADHPTLQSMRREMEGLRATPSGSGEGPALASTRADLAAARDRYGPEHPDVRRLERQVASLQSALPAEVPDNPAWVQLQTQAQAARQERASLRGSLADLERRRADYEARLAAAPQVEREYRALERDYQNAVAKFQDVRAKQLEANIAESLESERKGERFTLIEPPLLPERPQRPNRPLILLAGLLLAGLAGAGVIGLLDALDATVRDARDLVALAGVAPLAVIPDIRTRAEQARRRQRRHLVAVVATIGIVAVLAGVHFAVKPLDVAWILILRRFGFYGLG